MFRNWFENLPFNAKYLDLEDINKTFQAGGYYRVDLTNNISVLALNTLMFNKKNNEVD